MTRSKTSLRGLTLIEALLFLGIAAIVIVGALSLFNNASNSNALNQAKTEVQSYIAGIQSLYATQSTYGTVDITELVIDAGIAPANTINGTNLVNPWKGDTTITGAGRFFEIVMSDVPREACTNILASGLISEGSIVEIDANGNTYDSTTEPTPAAAAASCNDPTANVVTFRAR